MALFERHRGFWGGLRRAGQRRRRQELDRVMRLAVEVLEIRVTPSVSTWSGASTVDTNWSDANNWVGDVAPLAGDDLVFPAGAASLSSTNDFPAGTSFSSLTINSAGYTIGGLEITLTGAVDVSFAPAQGADSDEVDLPLDLNGSAAVNVDQSGVSLLLGGAISGIDGLDKTGAGLLDLLGANDYSGATVVDGGVLYVNTTQPLSPVTVNSGATLGGTGTVGAITSNSGEVSPGTSTPSILTSSDALTMGTGSTFAVSLNGLNAGTDYSQLSVPGQVTLGGATLAATGTGGTIPVGNNQFTIINNTGTGAISGTFAGLAEGAELTIADHTYQISYHGGPTQNNVVLTELVNTTTTVTPTPNSVTYGQPVSLTAEVASTDSSLPGPPTGNVEFFNGTTSLGSAPLGSAGVATLDDVILTGGADSITAMYTGDTSFAASTSPPATVTVAQAPTNTGVTVTPSSLVSGQQVMLSATVSPVNSGGVTPTGNVQFFSGAQLLGTGSVISGVATLQTSGLTTADTSVTASYQGDGNYLPSDSSASNVTVSEASTTTALTISPGTSGLGMPVVLTAVVTVSTPGSGTPTGNVDFLNGTALIGTQPLTGNSASLTTSSLPMGTSTITARYDGDTNFGTSTSPSQNASVLNASASLVTSSQSQVVFGQTVTLTATVAPAVSGTTPAPTGNVQFLSGTASLGTATLANNTATLNNVSLPTGADSITVVYAGDGNYAGSTSPAISVTVQQASTTTSVAVTPNPSGLGQTATLTATVVPVSPGAGSPTGQVQFFSGTTSLGMSAVTSGVATFPTTALTFGANSITATYLGDSNFSASPPSPAVTATVNQASVTTLTAAPTTAITGQPVTLTAVVAPSSGTATPTGTVQFFNGSASLGSSPVDSTGTAVLTTMALTVGTPSLTAVYSGDSSFAGSTSSAVPVTITMASTTTAVNVVPNPSASGASVTLTATVTPVSPATGTPTGTVNFFNGTTSLGTATLLSNGTASTTASTGLNVGANTITATYEGDTNYSSSTSPAFTQNVLPTTTTTVASSPSPSVVGQPVTLTAGVSSTAGVPTGTVQFFSGTNSLGTGTLSGGVASIVTTALTSGFNNITATYQGSSSFSPSTSSAITATVNQASTTMSLTGSPNPASLGQSVTFTARIIPSPPSTGGPTPTGSVTFMDGTTALGSGTLVNGVATFTTSTLTTGTHSITGVYVNDSNYTSSTSPAFTQTITLAVPSVILGVGNGNPVSNEAVVLTATLTAISPATAIPTGTVDFFSNGTMIGSGTLTNGQATFTSTTFALGNQTLEAVYLGDTNFAGGVGSNSLNIKVGDGNQLYVNQLYLQMLNTIADPSGLGNYSTLLANGFTRKYVVRQIANLGGLLKDSKLERNVLGSKAAARQSSSRQVTNIYQKTLGRAPTSTELKSGVALINHAGANALIINLLSSNEYFKNAFTTASVGAVASVS